jgi:hypothetical protein
MTSEPAQDAESVAKGMRLERERIVRWLDWRGLTATARDVETGVHWRYDDEPDPLLNDGPGSGE